jgi:FkbM family methyltransferase
MKLLERIAFRLLRHCEYQLQDIWDSWRLVLANKGATDEHTLTRRINRFLMMGQLKSHWAMRGVDLVIDVGGYEGDFSANLRRQGFDGQIVCVEPNPDLQDKLLKRFVSDPKWRLETAAVGMESGQVELSVSRDRSFSSTLPFSSEAARIFGQLVELGRSVTVQRKRLEQVIEETERLAGRSFKSILLKSDTQGLDREVVDSLGDFLDRVVVLHVEVPAIPIYRGVGGMPEHLEHYARLGFDIAGCYPVSWTSEGAVVEFDCVYVRAPHRMIARY